MPSFVMVGSSVQAILRFCLNKLRGCSIGITDGKGFMKCSIKMASGVMVNIQSVMSIGSGIQVILRLLPQKFEMLQ
jgi:hypothetical protein